MVGRRDVVGLLLKRLKSFFLEPSFAPSESRFDLPKPESMRAGVADIVQAQCKQNGQRRIQLIGAKGVR